MGANRVIARALKLNPLDAGDETQRVWEAVRIDFDVEQLEVSEEIVQRRIRQCARGHFLSAKDRDALRTAHLVNEMDLRLSHAIEWKIVDTDDPGIGAAQERLDALLDEALRTLSPHLRHLLFDAMKPVFLGGSTSSQVLRLDSMLRLYTTAASRTRGRRDRRPRGRNRRARTGSRAGPRKPPDDPHPPLARSFAPSGGVA